MDIHGYPWILMDIPCREGRGRKRENGRRVGGGWAAVGGGRQAGARQVRRAGGQQPGGQTGGWADIYILYFWN